MHSFCCNNSANLHVFEKIGRSKIVDVFDMDENILVKHSISEVVKAVEIMSLKQIGALIVFERNSFHNVNTLY